MYAKWAKNLVDGWNYSWLHLIRPHQNTNFVYELSTVLNYQYNEICLN